MRSELLTASKRRLTPCVAGALVALIVAIGAQASVSSSVAQRYAVVDLGTLGGMVSQATGINQPGVVSGLATTSGGGTHAALWDDGQIVDLGTLGGTSGVAIDVNPRGRAVGVSTNPVGVNRAFLWEDGVMSDLGSLGGPIGRANRINPRGEIVGFSSTADGPIHATHWYGGTTTDLGTFGGSFSLAAGINSAGEVVGAATYPDGLERGALWTHGAMIDLDALPPAYPNSRAIRINDRDQAVGWAATAPGVVEQIVGATHAVLWSAGEVVDLGTLGGGPTSRAYGINNLTQVVGTARTAAGADHAFLWRDGLITDANDLLPADSGWTLTIALGIDEQGAIVGQGIHDGQRHAFLLEPSWEARR
jgi:probable HAF family extracellular repeat protein